MGAGIWPRAIMFEIFRGVVRSSAATYAPGSAATSGLSHIVDDMHGNAALRFAVGAAP